MYVTSPGFAGYASGGKDQSSNASMMSSGVQSAGINDSALEPISYVTRSVHSLCGPKVASNVSSIAIAAAAAPAMTSKT